MAHYRPQTHPRELLVKLLWPECEFESGRHRLSMARSLPCRGTWDPCCWRISSRWVLDPGAAGTDVEEFEQALAAATAARAARCRRGS